MRYRFTRIVADVEVAVGVIIMIAGAGLAIGVIWNPSFLDAVSPPRPGRPDLALRVAGTLLILLVGAAVGAAFIVAGQLILVFLDMRSRLVRIDRRLRSRGERSEPSTPTEQSRRRL